MLKKLIFITSFAFVLPIFGQEIQLPNQAKLVFSGYGETYLSYAFDSNYNNERPNLYVSHHKNREFSINYAQLKVKLEHASYRANLGLQMGSFVERNLAGEPDALKYLSECNVGFKIFPKHRIWLDAGIFSSHIGMESAIGLDNKTVSRTLISENTPYYEAGAKLSYQSINEKLEISVSILNGWQRLRRNSPLGYGMQVKYKMNDKFNFNYSNYLGYMNAREFRHYHNIYVQSEISKKFNGSIGFDLGFQQINGLTNVGKKVIGTFITMQYKHSEKWRFAARLEKFSDAKSMIVNLDNFSGIAVDGYSFNIDYHFSKHIVFRNEIKYLNADQPIFRQKLNALKTDNVCLLSSLNFIF
ncbi:MAG: porin [Bacteroidetes bacterium]|nr:porin [Bacteroidota bacterium]